MIVKNQNILRISLIAVLMGIMIYFFTVFRNSGTTGDSVTPRSGSAGMFRTGAAGPPDKDNVTPSFDQTVSQLERSVKTNPHNAGHLKALAHLLMDGHRMKDAVPYLEQALHEEPKNDSLMFDLAVCYYGEGRYDQALTVTDRILALGRRVPEALYNKGAILAAQGKQEEARRAWKRLTEVAPNSEEAQKAKAHIGQLGTR